MAEPWIRVHANLGMKAVVFRLMEGTGVSRHEAIGLLVEFWGKVAQYRRDGNLSAESDMQLEAWAGWNPRGVKAKRGKFAAFVRAHHLDADGVIKEWRRYASHLEERVEREESPDGKSTYVYYAVDGDACKIGWSGNPWSRVHEMRTARPSIRLAAVEKGNRGLEAERHGEFVELRIEREWFRLGPALAAHIQSVATTTTGGRSNDDRGKRSNYDNDDRSNDAPRAPARARARAVRDEDETIRNNRTTTTSSSSAREELLSRVPHRPTWEAEISAALLGMHGTPLSEAQIDQAVGEYVGDGHSVKPSLRHFRAYLRNVSVSPTGHSQTMNRKSLTPGEQSYLAGKAAFEDES